MALRYANRTEFTLNYFDTKAGGAVPRYRLSYSPTDLVMVTMAFNQSWEDPWYVMEEVGLYPFHPKTERPEPLRERNQGTIQGEDMLPPAIGLPALWVPD